LKADESLQRNPVLAKLFRIEKLCETAGYGFDKMLEWKYQTGNDVLFESTVDKTKFTFMLDTAVTEKSGMIPKESSTESDTEIENGGIESGMKQKTVEKIMALISKDNTISITQVSTETKISRSTIQ
jgi:predicted HTH transcriptional regulator